MPDSTARVLDRTTTADDVQALLREAVLSRTDEGITPCLVMDSAGRRQNSVIFRAECGIPPKPLLVKVCTERTGDTVAEARHQSNSLDVVGRVMGEDSRFTVPRPHPILIQNGCVVMDWVDGKSVSQLLEDWKVSYKVAAESASLAGQWLQKFHNARPLGVGCFDTDRLDRDLDEVLSGLHPRPSDQPLFDAAENFLKQHANEVSRIPVQRSWHHGDFKPDNVLISHGRVFGIDLEVIDDGECLHDVANFLVQLDLALLRPSGLRLLPFHRAIRNAFVEGYARDNAETPLHALTSLPFKWLCLRRLVRAWAEQERSRTRGVRLWYLRRCFHHLISAALAEEAVVVSP